MKNQAALITGSSDRIGKAIALSLADSGHNIILHYNRSKDKAMHLLKVIEGKGAQCIALQADFRIEKDIQRLFEQANKKFQVNILINNASDFVKSSIEDDHTDLLDHMMMVNFKAAYILTKQFIKSNKQGSIINVLDTQIRQNQTLHFDYLLSKKALEAFTMQSALALGPSRIRVNAIAPGLILPPEGENQSYLEHRARKIPLRRPGSVKNIQDSVQFLIENDFITGQILYVDGGEKL